MKKINVESQSETGSCRSTTLFLYGNYSYLYLFHCFSLRLASFLSLRPSRSRKQKRRKRNPKFLVESQLTNRSASFTCRDLLPQHVDPFPRFSDGSGQPRPSHTQVRQMRYPFPFVYLILLVIFIWLNVFVGLYP